MSTALAVAELSKLLLSGYFTYAKQQGLSEEETLKIYQDSKQSFDENDPSKLEQV